MGKSCFSRARKRKTEKMGMQLVDLSPPRPLASANNSVVGAASPLKAKKKTGARLWMRLDHFGQSELMECDKSIIMKRVSIPARDLRILGPIFSHSSSVHAREKAIVVNLEFIKAIVTAEEVLLLDPLRQEVLPFVDQLRQQLSFKSSSRVNGGGPMDYHEREDLQSELPFEFQVLEVALEVVYSYLDASVADLEVEAYPLLDELARKVSTKNLERVRSLKSNFTHLLARVQKVRDEIKSLLDDNEDMSQLCLTRKLLQTQQLKALMAAGASTCILPAASLPRGHSSFRSNASLIFSAQTDNDVEDLEILLEAYFMQLEGTRNRILSVREYIDDTEDYVNIQLDNQRNELIQLQLVLTTASLVITSEFLITGLFSINIHCSLYDKQGLFAIFVGCMCGAGFVVFLAILGYARWKKLLGS